VHSRRRRYRAHPNISIAKKGGLARKTVDSEKRGSSSSDHSTFRHGEDRDHQRQQEEGRQGARTKKKKADQKSIGRIPRGESKEKRGAGLGGKGKKKKERNPLKDVAKAASAVGGNIESKKGGEATKKDSTVKKRCLERQKNRSVSPVGQRRLVSWKGGVATSGAGGQEPA